ncbi:tRNA1(Val) (adenine(37)-N6)-methyltransferase [Clostridium algidicarnis]|uniref:tRNA1(Val) (adenine(37)-N6)-methyltransferase n=1 Tax=Clostridium algidicarnis TaxID=37659 RepID=UPI001CF56DA5|nr:tRNA1(Val) (adenine(37)-N6)-methyltransferase [Clostridium algidicarnis]MCB2287743.1 tRNA1(Val) (adenine(37)-N6)-methyltransferase [Clostridium algidicarnis]
MIEDYKNYIKEDETLDDLQLKGIHIIQKTEGFRFGVDAVLLANFAKTKRNSNIMDLCTGTGIVPLLIAGKKEFSKITALEIQNDMVDMAKRSVIINDLKEKVDFKCEDLKDLKYLKTLDKVDVLTVNPPYKVYKSGILNVSDKDAIARHEVACTLEDVIIASRILLKDNGRMFMVHRPERLADILCTMRKHKIEPKTIRLVHPNSKKAPNIVLVEGQRDGGAFLKFEPPLYIYEENGEYSEEIKNIYNEDITVKGD